MKTNRILSLILAFSIIMTSLFVGSVYAEDTVDDAIVITRSHYNYQLLSKLGILPEEIIEYLNINNLVSRGLLARAAVKMRGEFVDEAAESTGVFKDVTKDTVNYAYVEKAYEANIMNGYGDGNFAPDKAVTYGEFLKTMVNLLGGTDVANVKGGYYRGYYSVALQEKILPQKGVDLNAEITLGEAVDIMVNTMSAPVFRIGTVGQNITYEEGDSLFSTHFDVYSMEGVLNAVYGYDIYRTPNCELNTIEVDGYTLICGEDDYYGDFLGLNTMTYFKRQRGNKDTVVQVVPESYEELSLRGDVIKEKSQSGTEITYEDETENKKKKIKLDSDAILVYNGVNRGYAKDIEATLLFSRSADFKFVDNNIDGEFDVVFVWEYEVVSVSAYNRTTGVLYFNQGSTFKGSNSYYIGEENAEMPFYIYYDGEFAKRTTMRKDDIVSIAESANEYGNKTLTLYVSRATVEGTATLVDDNKVTLESGEGETATKSEYYMIPNFDDVSKDAFPFGKSAEYFVDHRGDLAAVSELAASDSEVSYLTHIGFINDGFSTRIGFKMFKKNSKFETFEGADKITLKVTVGEGSVEETVYKAEKYEDLKAKIVEVLRGYDPIAKTYDKEWCGGLCKYSLTVDDKIDSIWISKNLAKVDSTYPGSDTSTFSLDFSSKQEYVYATWVNTQIWLAGTTGYYVPNQIFNETVDEDAYVTGNWTIMGRNQDYMYNFEIYDLSESELAKAKYIVGYYDPNSGEELATESTPTDAKTLLVTGSSIVATEDGSFYKLTGIHKGSNYQCLFPIDDELPVETPGSNDPFDSKFGKPQAERYTVADLKYGDIIQPTLDNMNKLVGFRVLYKKDRDEGTYFSKGYNVSNGIGTAEVPMAIYYKRHELSGIYGVIVATDKKAGTATIKWREGDATHPEEHYYINHHIANGDFYRYKFENGEAQTIAASEFEIGDEVFVRGRWNECYDIILLKD